MKLSKAITISALAKLLPENREEMTIDIIREERYVIEVMQVPLFSAYITPDQLEEYAYGRMLAERLVRKASDIAHIRICEDNKYLLQLCPEITDKIHKIGSVGAYVASIPQTGWGDIISIRSMLGFTGRGIMDLTGKLNEQFAEIEDKIYYAAYVVDGSLVHIAYDASEDGAVYKLCGLLALNERKEGFVLTNCTATLKIIQSLYEFEVAMGVFGGNPTNGALLFAKKAGITVIGQADGKRVVFADTARRIRA